MARVTYAVPSRKRRKRLLEQAKGFYGNSSRNLRNAYDAVERAQRHAYVGRKQKKQQYRALWIVRINAACRALDVNYSRFMDGRQHSVKWHHCYNFCLLQSALCF